MPPESLASAGGERGDGLNLIFAKEENTRRRRLVADLSLDKEMLQEVIRKKL